MDMTQQAIYLPMAYVPRYEISQDGVVRHSRTKKERKLTMSKYGTLHLKIHKHTGYASEYRNAYVCIAEAVALAFHGPRPEGTLLYHRDGNRGNVHASNLYYGAPGSEGVRSKLKAQNRQISLRRITPEIEAAVHAKLAGRKPTQRGMKAMAAEFGLSKHVMVAYFCRGQRPEAILGTVVDAQEAS